VTAVATKRSLVLDLHIHHKHAPAATDNPTLATNRPPVTGADNE
jgi:hypothetical protein